MLRPKLNNSKYGNRIASGSVKSENDVQDRKDFSGCRVRKHESSRLERCLETTG